jgi:hypothetical protein
VDRELRILLDERAINAVMNEYCHAMDTGQHDRWMNCFTTDAVYDVAQAGSGQRHTDTLHSIDPATVKSQVTAAGFEFVGESKLLTGGRSHQKGLRSVGPGPYRPVHL